MSTSNFFNGQSVIITDDHNHLKASNEAKYHVASINRVQGSISVQLLQDGKSVGAVPESKLAPSK